MHAGAYELRITKILIFMRRFTVLLLAGLIALPSLALATTTSSAKESSGTKWALFGAGKKNHNQSKKAKKAKKAKKSKKAGKSAKASH